ncbi:MAG: hypothetical protein ACR2JW_12120 [Thermomicrobiales bacterium]
MIGEVESRQLTYFNQIMPMVVGASLSPVPDIETIEQAQKALLLASYYGLLEATLKGQELFLAPWTATKDPQERDREAGEWRRKADAENARLQAVQERGNWRPLKEWWLRRVPPNERLPETQGGDGDWLRKSYDAIKGALRPGPATYDYGRTQRVLDLVPDETAPVRASSLDPDPALL